MAHAGDVLPVTFKLFDINSSVYVMATVKTDAGVPLTGSPATLTSVGLGRYSSTAFLMPAGVNYVTVDYQVFSDAGLTIPSTVYSNGSDQFALETGSGGGGVSYIIAETVVGVIECPVQKSSCHSCTPVRQVNVIQNTDTSIFIRLVSGTTGDPLDLSQYVPAASGNIRANFVNDDGTTLVLSLSGASGVAVATPLIGKIQLSLTEAQTSDLNEGMMQSFELELIKNSGTQNLSVVQFLNALNVLPRIS